MISRRSAWLVWPVMAVYRRRSWCRSLAMGVEPAEMPCQRDLPPPPLGQPPRTLGSR